MLATARERTEENNSRRMSSSKRAFALRTPQGTISKYKTASFRVPYSCKKEKKREGERCYINLVIRMHAASTFFQGQLPTFPPNIHKDSFTTGERTYLCNIPKSYSSGNISNYVCLDAEKLHVKQNSIIGKNRLNILKHVYKLEMYSVTFSSIARWSVNSRNSKFSELKFNCFPLEY